MDKGEDREEERKEECITQWPGCLENVLCWSLAIERVEQD